MDFLKLLEDKAFIQEWAVLNNRRWEAGFYYKSRVLLSDASIFQATEYKDIIERNYSFHWQDADNKLIIRWDNAPHHPYLKTHPYHKHYLDQVEESKEMTLLEALEEIEAMLKQ